MTEPKFSQGETEDNILTMPTDKYEQLRKSIKEEIREKSRDKIITKVVKEKLKKKKKVELLRKFLKIKGSIPRLQRRTIKQARIPEYKAESIFWK